MATNVEVAHAAATATMAPRDTALEAVGQFIHKKPLGAAGAFIILAMLVIAAFAGALAPYDAFHSEYGLQFSPPSAEHWFGTDEFGRDVLSRIVWGARVSLEVGLASVVVAVALGVPLGILAGFRGGHVETGIMRASDMLMAFPTLLLALIIVTALGGTLLNEILAIGVALTPNFVRLARSLALTIRDQDYIVAARALGGGQLRLMARHVFPNTLYALVVVATLYIATAIRTEASLSFLGLGIPPPTPSWGNILSEGRQYIKCCPWITTFSGLAIMLAVLAFNLVGDALRDLLDPRLRGE